MSKGMRACWGRQGVTSGGKAMNDNHKDTCQLQNGFTTLCDVNSRKPELKVAPFLRL